MRSEQDMMNLIMDTARGDDRIRAVIMNGSRANPNAPKDFFQDFDIVYAVKDIDTFTADHSWIKIFGDLMILQMPKSGKLILDEQDGSCVYLMQFMDGNRIDLTLIPLENIKQITQWESQSILLLDKDGIIKPFPPISDADFIIPKPNAQFYADCCNEFWWICPYVAKGIWRDELPYAMYMHDRHERDMVMQMLDWYIGIKTDFTVSRGKYGKYYKKYLELNLWDMYVATYAEGSYDSLWKALFASCELFRTIAQKVGEHFGYEYPMGDDQRVTAHLKYVKELPRDAKQMYE